MSLFSNNRTASILNSLVYFLRISAICFPFYYDAYLCVHPFGEGSEFVKKRKKVVESILKGFRPWLEKKALQVSPSSLLGKAGSYAFGQWEKLDEYLDRAFLTPDTSLVENAIRPFVPGQKSLLFSGSPQGAFATEHDYRPPLSQNVQVDASPTPPPIRQFPQWNNSALIYIMYEEDVTVIKGAP